jgi:tetratricopeptide (TPR) repeat protein
VRLSGRAARGSVVWGIGLILLCAGAPSVGSAQQGGEHPDLVEARRLRDEAVRGNRDLGQAEALLRRALGLQTRVVGREHPEVAHTLQGFALLYVYNNRYDEAEKYQKLTLAMLAKTVGVEAYDFAWGLLQLAKISAGRGQDAAAEQHLLESLRIATKTEGASAPQLSVHLGALSEFYLVRRRFREAEPILLRELALEEQVEKDDFPKRWTLDKLARVYDRLGRLNDAEVYLRRLAKVLEGTSLEDDVQLRRGRMYFRHGRIKEAEPLLRRAVAGEVKSLERGESLIYLGVALSGQSPQEAVGYLQQGLEMLSGWSDTIFPEKTALKDREELVSRDQIEDLRQAVLLGFESLGRTLQALGRHDDAQQAQHVLRELQQRAK